MQDLLVIKIGGNIIDDEKALAAFLAHFSSLPKKKILVHGGGKMATRMADQLGISQKLIEGRRITDAETLRVITMVYAGYINKNIVAQLQSHHCNAVGLSGADGDSVLAHKRVHPVIDYGFVGDVDLINVPLFTMLLDQDLTVVMAPITHDQQGQLLNTNADTMAQEIAKALSQEYAVQLVYIFEKPGVLQDVADETSVIRKITATTFAELKAAGAINAGMIPKLDNAFTAVQSGVKKVTIGAAGDLEELIRGNKGTTIIHE
jgi:acetylglutamate kinase